MPDNLDNMQNAPLEQGIPLAGGTITQLDRSVKFTSPFTEDKVVEIFFNWPSIGKPGIIHPENLFQLPLSILAKKGLWPIIQQNHPTLISDIVKNFFVLQEIGRPNRVAALVLEQRPLVVAATFSNITGIPNTIVGIANDDTLAALNTGDEQVRVTVESTAFISNTVMNNLFSENIIFDSIIGDDDGGDFPPPPQDPMEVTRININLRVANSNQVQDSTLYDVSVRVGDNKARRIVPHAYYVKESWKDFSFIHATDLHIALRNDQFRAKLRAAGKNEGAKEYNNWNDAFRDLVHYANHLHEKGLLDFILATGDIVDYVHEWPLMKGIKGNKSDAFAYDPIDGSHLNMHLFIQIVLGQSPYPNPEMSKIAHEELRVPIFTTLGNHDYRINPFYLRAKVEQDVPGILGLLFPPLLIPAITDIPITSTNNFENYNLTQDEADVLHGGNRPIISPGAALAPLDIGDSMIVSNAHSYIVALGPHRLVVLDTGPDAGLFKNTIDTLIAKFGLTSNEDELNLADFSPNSEGINQKEINLVRKALLEAGNSGQVIVGLHAPPLNPKGNEFPHYFRETEHATSDKRDIIAYLLRRLGGGVIEPEKIAEEWQLTAKVGNPSLLNFDHWDLKHTPFFKTGGINNLLDWGIASRIEGKTEEFLRLCAGAEAGIQKKVDLVLFGHIHNRVEYRLEWINNELHYFMDFYSQNPIRYYRSRKFGFDKAVQVQVTNTQSTGPVTEASAENPNAFWDKWNNIEIPKYPNPLNQSKNPKQWWDEHKPILAQTAPLGPMESNQRKDKDLNEKRPGPTFQGFRVIFVQNNVIAKMRYVTMRRLRNNDFRMPWEPGVDNIPIGEDKEEDGPLIGGLSN